MAVGETLTLEAHLGSTTMTFTPAVLEVRPERELRWLGRALLPGIFDGEHRFTFNLLEDRRVRVVQGEVFRGVLVPFFGALLDDTERGFESFNRALKARAEASVSS